MELEQKISEFLNYYYSMTEEGQRFKKNSMITY